MSNFNSNEGPEIEASQDSYSRFLEKEEKFTTLWDAYIHMFNVGSKYIDNQKAWSEAIGNKVELSVMLSFLERWPVRNKKRATDWFYIAPSVFMKWFSWKEGKQRRLIRILKSLDLIEVEIEKTPKGPIRWVRIKFEQIEKMIESTEGGDPTVSTEKELDKLKSKTRSSVHI